jgi:hypothetical protein
MTRAIHSLIRFESRAKRYACRSACKAGGCAGLIFWYARGGRGPGTRGKPITGCTGIISCKPPRAAKSHSLAMRELVASRQVDTEFHGLGKIFFFWVTVSLVLADHTTTLRMISWKDLQHYRIALDQIMCYQREKYDYSCIEKFISFIERKNCFF